MNTTVRRGQAVIKAVPGELLGLSVAAYFHVMPGLARVVPRPVADKSDTRG